MIEQIYKVGNSMVVITINGKEVTYSDEKRTNIDIKGLIDNKRMLSEFNRRIEEVTSEKEIAEEISQDLKKMGFVLVEVRNE